MEVQVRPRTPPEVLEEQRKAIREVAQNIEEAKAVCAKAVDQVSQDWEEIIDDAELEKVTEELGIIEANVNMMKSGMKKFP